MWDVMCPLYSGNWVIDIFFLKIIFVLLQFLNLLKGNAFRWFKSQKACRYTRGTLSSHPCLVFFLVPTAPKFLVYPSRISHAPTINKNILISPFLLHKKYIIHPIGHLGLLMIFLTQGGDILIVAYIPLY